MNTTSTAARRIATTHNKRLRHGFAGNGFLVFDREGEGGAWYNDNSCPALADDEIKISIRWSKMTLAEAQEILDEA